MRRNRAKTAVAGAADLPPDMLANIHGRLSLLDRLAFAAVFRALRDVFKPEAPCLVLPGDGPAASTLFSLADRRAAAVLAPDPDHVILGSSSSRGWLVTADDRARLLLVNPVTGERHALPAIDTIPHIFADAGRHHFGFYMMWFLRGPPPYPYGAITLRAEEMQPALSSGCSLVDDPGRYKDARDPYYNGIGVFSLKDGSREKVEGLGLQRSWPPPVWFMPSIP